MTAGPAQSSRRIPVVAVRRDGGTQVRESMNATTVQDYADALANGAEFPPVVVFHDGADHWLADGFHRLLAHEKAGLVDILADVRHGTKRDALLFAIGANASHGLPRTNKDKRRAVEFLLRDEEWATWTPPVIAKRACVSRDFVHRLRDELSLKDNCPVPETRTGADGKQYPTRKAKKTTTDDADLRAAVDADNAELAEIGREIDAANGHEDLGAVVGKAYHRVSEHAVPAVDEMARARRAEIDHHERAARHPLLDELDRAADRDALDRVYSKVAVANLSSDEAEAAGEVYRRRLSELRAKAPAAPVETPTPPPAPPSEPAPKSAPKQADLFADDSVPVSTQAPASQPAQAAASDELASLRAENAAFRQWVAVIDQRSRALAPTIKGAANLDRIRRLIELAGSPSENEARNAAMLACRMIREQGVKLLSSDPTLLDDIHETNRQMLETARSLGVTL